MAKVKGIAVFLTSMTIFNFCSAWNKVGKPFLVYGLCLLLTRVAASVVRCNLRCRRNPALVAHTGFVSRY